VIVDDAACISGIVGHPGFVPASRSATYVFAGALCTRLESQSRVDVQHGMAWSDKPGKTGVPSRTISECSGLRIRALCG
jgi:hypothetical protein